MSNSAIIRGFVSRAGTAGVRSCDRSGMTALHHAALRCITQENPIPRKPAQEHDLFLFRCDKESAAELLSHSADVFARDIHDRTPLHIAAFSGASDITLLLCKNKADVHAKDKFGFAHFFAPWSFLRSVFVILPFRSTALHCAAMQGRKECVRVLLQHGASSVCFILPLFATFDASLVAF
jgi:ankyrin repeat protein